MEPILIVRTALQRLAWRRRWVESVRRLGDGILWGAIFWASALAIYKIAPLPPQTPWVAALLGAAVALGGFLIGFSRLPTLASTARWLDQEKKLQERVSTALEIAETPTPSPWQALVLKDAATTLGQVSTQDLLPFRTPRSALWSLVPLIVGLILLAVPEYRSQAERDRQREMSVVRETGKELAGLLRQQIAPNRPLTEPTEKAIREAVEFGEKLSQVATTKAEALRDLTSLTKKLENELQKLEEKPALRTLEKAARDPSSGEGPAELQSRADALKQAMGSAAGKEAAVDKLKAKLEKLAEAAKQAPTGSSAEAQAAREQLAQSLGDLAREAKDAGIPLGSLEEAANALRNANPEFFLRDLGAALQELDKLQQLGKNLKQLQQEMARQAKDLPEQLKMGQAKAAQSTLQKMMEQLRAGTLPPEQLQKLLDEVSKSIGPAKDYGKVADHLQKAADQLTTAQKSGGDGQKQRGAQSDAAQSLADAAKELEQLLQQMGEGDQLASALDAMDRANMAIASGKGFGECKNPGRPRFGRGGKPGKGVGTWADEEGWTQIPEQSQGWDNSGIQQPAMDSKGLTDRGEGEHNPNLTPTKVNGQFSPGGSMQSITLKGVHIKGQSQVKLTEATAAAQAEAQSALNQDKVPRAYQQTVRDYFDDFKR